MYASMNFTEFDVTPHLRSSATVDEHGQVTDVSVRVFPFGDHELRVDAGQYMHSNPVTLILSLDEAEVLARLLTGAVADARSGEFDEIERE